MKMIRISLCFALAGSVLACSGSDDQIDIGDRNVREIGSQLTDYAGAWDGYAEAYEFPSGSDRVRITLDASGNGSVEFGDQPPLVMSSDPHVGFPPVTPDEELSPDVIPLKEGFDYTVTSPSLEARRFRFGLGMGEIIAPWCELQTSYVQTEWLPPGSVYGCIPHQTGRMNFPEENHCELVEQQGEDWITVPADCDWVGRCTHRHCVCDATDCEANPSLGTATFDATLENEGADLVGTLSFPAYLKANFTTTRLTVRLTRTP